MPYVVDLTGQKFGRVLVLKRVRYKPEGWKKESTFYDCLCDCGREYRTSHSNLVSGRTGYRRKGVCEQSCGCAQHEWVAGLQALADGESEYNTVEKYYKENAGKAGISWFLSREEFRSFLHKPCSYCGSLDSMEKTTLIGGNSLKYNGIDRVDSDLDYTMDNCVTACKWCNWAKREIPKEDFLLHVERIHRYEKS